jgi:hypothetical protein
MIGKMEMEMTKLAAGMEAPGFAAPTPQSLSPTATPYTAYVA